MEKKSPDRFNVFSYNAHRVHKSNKLNKQYKLKLNRFADLTHDEFKSKYADSKIAHKLALQGARPCPQNNNNDISNIPESIDWREHNAVTPVKDQGQCGKTIFFFSFIYLFLNHTYAFLVNSCDNAPYLKKIIFTRCGQ